MATIKSYTDLEQSKKLAEILPLESADMTLPFRHPKNDEYIPGYVVSRNYVEVYNEMIKLPGMKKEDVCKLIQPSWSLAALLGILPVTVRLLKDGNISSICDIQYHCECPKGNIDKWFDNPIDACYELILKLNELKML